MIKAIIFDCWKTLFYTDLDPHPFVEFAELIGQDRKDYGYIKKFEKHFMLEEHLDHREPTLSLLKELKIEPTEELLNKLIQVLEVSSRIITPYPETLETLSELRKKYGLGLMTNTEHLGYQKLKEDFGIENLFDFTIPSFETGLAKPDPAIFEMMLEKLEVKKDEAVMVGDSLPDDYMAAKSYGMHAILVDRKDRHPEIAERVKDLTEVSSLIEKIN